MRTAMLIAKAASGKLTLLCDASVALNKQKERYKQIVSDTKDGDPNIAEVQLWTSSSGITKRKKWNSPEVEKAIAAAIAKEAKAEAPKIAPRAEAKAKS